MCLAAQFAGFQQQIEAAISRLGGKVMPKLNWSAPKVGLEMGRGDCTLLCGGCVLLEEDFRCV